MDPVVLRMDDVGSSQKYWGGRKLWPFSDYREMEAEDIVALAALLNYHKAKLTVGLTSRWVNLDGTTTPYNKRFPSAAHAWREAIYLGVVEIANHGMTHCVLGQHRKRWLRSNRAMWREFHEWVPSEIRRTHFNTAMCDISRWAPVPRTFIPPGNVFTSEDIGYAQGLGITCVCFDKIPINFRWSSGVACVGSESMFAFHDKDVLFNGIGWLDKHIRRLKRTRRFVFAREIEV